MLPTALEYPRNAFHVYRPARGGRLCEHFGGYKTINRTPLPMALAPFLGTVSIDNIRNNQVFNTFLGLMLQGGFHVNEKATI